MVELAYQRPGPIKRDDLDALPHNLDAEQALLGAILFDNEVYNRVGDFLTAPHFYDPVHGRIYAVSAELIGKGALADGVTLKNRFERDEGLAEIGGAEYLADLMGRAIPSAMALDYARIIYDLALRRDLVRAADEIRYDALDGNSVESGRSHIEAAERKIFGLLEPTQKRGGLQPFSIAAAKAMDMAAAAHAKKGGVSGLSTGFRDLDAQLGGLHGSDLIILAGRPSMGKTALATNIAYNVARDYVAESTPEGGRKTVRGGVVGFFSLEMSEEQLALRILSERAKVDSNRIRKGEISPAEFNELKRHQGELDSLPLHIDDQGALAVAQIAARARRMKHRNGLDLIVVDYLQLGCGDKARLGNGNRVQEVTEITTGLKALAKELNVPVVALSQLSRQVENRDDKRPQLSDLRESGSIEQDADVVMFVFRESYYVGRAEPREGTPEHDAWVEQMAEIGERAEIIIGKQRHGPIGTVKLSFEGRFTRFYDLEKYRGAQ